MAEQTLVARVAELEKKLKLQQEAHVAEVARYTSEIAELKEFVDDLKITSPKTGAEHFSRRVEWTITDYAKKAAGLADGKSIWSGKFKACGLEGLELEFFPQGRGEKTEQEGFCSLFLWCEGVAKIRYVLWVGKYRKMPDLDDFTGKIGHGHSTFCPVAPEVHDDTITLGVELMEVFHDKTYEKANMKLSTDSMSQIVTRQVGAARNLNSTKVVWTIHKMSEQLQRYPKGQSMWSPHFTAGGIKEILLEFFPNGNEHTSKEGHCGFYLRCPAGITMVVTLFVGSFQRRPIRATFEGNTGKGLPDFCPILEHISANDTLEVGIIVQNEPMKTLIIEDNLSAPEPQTEPHGDAHAQEASAAEEFVA